MLPEWPSKTELEKDGSQAHPTGTTSSRWPSDSRRDEGLGVDCAASRPTQTRPNDAQPQNKSGKESEEDADFEDSTPGHSLEVVQGLHCGISWGQWAWLHKSAEGSEPPWGAKWACKRHEILTSCSTCSLTTEIQTMVPLKIRSNYTAERS